MQQKVTPEPGLSGGRKSRRGSQTMSVVPGGADRRMSAPVAAGAGRDASNEAKLRCASTGTMVGAQLTLRRDTRLANGSIVS